MRHRNRLIGEYIKFQHSDVAEELFAINDVVVDDMKNYRGKDRYTVTLIIDDEEVEMTESTEEVPLDEDYYDAYTLEDDGEGTDFAVEDNLGSDDALDVETTDADVVEQDVENT